jgi:uncharacterized protein YjeT (DUF2065 family)
LTQVPWIGYRYAANCLSWARQCAQRSIHVLPTHPTERLRHMKWILYIISVLWIVFGSCAILYTASTRRSLKNVIQNFDLKIIAALPLITGLLLLFAASASHYPWFVRLIGLLVIIKGVFIGLNPNKMVDAVNQWYIDTATDQSYRFFGIMFIILGTALLSWVA